MNDEYIKVGDYVTLDSDVKSGYKDVFYVISKIKGDSVRIYYVSNDSAPTISYEVKCNELYSFSHSFYKPQRVIVKPILGNWGKLSPSNNSVKESRWADGTPIVNYFKSITDEMNETYIKKNSDYGSSFDKSIDEFGIVAAITRMSDKMERLKTLSKKEAKVKDESLLDTLYDLANYSVMTIMHLKNNKNQ